MLSSKDAAKVMGLLQQLYQQTNLAKLPASVVSVLASLVPSDAAAFNVIYDDDHRVEITHNAPWLNSEVARRTWALERHIDQHPLENFFHQTGSPEPVRISDFLSRKKFHDLALYQEFYKSLGVEYQISAFLRPMDKFRIGVGVQRQQKDFSERDKEVIACLTPHIFQAYQNAREFSQARSELSRTEEALRMHRQGFLHLEKEGRINSMTANCMRWLSAYCGDRRGGGDQLPELLRRWLQKQRNTAPASLGGMRRPLVLQRGDNRLVVRIAEHSDGSCDLLLQETDIEFARTQLMAAGLTSREAEVLNWLTQGKANSEIAIIVGARTGTINKHLEHIYTKLGVESRTAAASVALELIGHV
jgi:DNA-binding CsgD family transcriptional regulator